MSLLLRNGAEVDKTDAAGLTSLALAVQEGHVKPMQMLLEHGAGVDRCNVSGTAPLFLACSNGDEEAVKVLVEHGADVNLRCNEDDNDDYNYRMTSALDIACSYGHFGLVEKLVDTYGARVHETLDKVTHKDCDFGNRRRTITVDLMMPVQWLFYWDDRGGTESSPEERLLIFRFLVARGARVSFGDVLEFQSEEVARCMEDIESSPVQEVRKRVKPIIELAAAQLEVARQQERARRAAVAREILLFRSGRASFAEDSEDEDDSDASDGDDSDDDDEARLRCGISLLARVSLKGAFGQGFARRVLDHAFDNGESPRARTVPWADHEVGSPCALERHHREAYEAAVGA